MTRLCSWLDHPGRKLPCNSGFFRASPANDKYVRFLRDHGNGNYQLMWPIAEAVGTDGQRPIWLVNWWREQLFDAHVEDAFKKPRGCWPQWSQRHAVRLTACDETLKVSEAQRAGLIVVTSKCLDKVSELAKAETTFADLLFEDRSRRLAAAVSPGHRSSTPHLVASQA